MNSSLTFVNKLTPNDDWKILVSVESRTPLTTQRSTYIFATLCDRYNNKISLKLWNEAAEYFDTRLVKGGGEYIIEGSGDLLVKATGNNTTGNPYQINVNDQEDLIIKKVGESKKPTPEKSSKTTSDKNTNFNANRTSNKPSPNKNAFSVPCPNTCRDEVVVLMDRGRNQYRCFSCRGEFISQNKSPE